MSQEDIPSPSELESYFEGVDPEESDSWEKWLEDERIEDRGELQETISSVALYLSAFTHGSSVSHYSLKIGEFEEAFVKQYTDSTFTTAAYRDDLDEPWEISSNILTEKFHDDDGVTNYPDVRAVEEALTGQINAIENIQYDEV